MEHIFYLQVKQIIWITSANKKYKCSKMDKTGNLIRKRLTNIYRGDMIRKRKKRGELDAVRKIK